jgi:structure-specific recognition protein 1
MAVDIHVAQIGLSPPIRQGQTRYSYLVMNFPRDENMEAEIDMEQ